MKIIQDYFISQLDRYYFDFRECTYTKGWAQLDTDQDAHYYGMWINPTKQRIMSYMEGDIKEVQFDNVEELIEYLKDLNSDITQGEYARIDPGLDSNFIQAFVDLKLDQFFHKKLK